jgi:hypothetical protein
MFDRNYNSNGNHGVDLISYIYGEMDEHARSVFESHLERCDECAVELGAMSDARLGVVEWRRNDFDHLALPEILIPQESPEIARVPIHEKKGVFAGLTEWIGAASVFAKAGVGLATAALLIGVVYFAFVQRMSTDTVVGVNRDKDVPETVASKEENKAPENKRPDIAEKQPIEHNEIRDVTPGRSSSPVRSRSVNARQLAANPSKLRTNDRKLKSEMAVKTVPRLSSYDEEEDRTLRLSDLFGQVGPVRK